MINFKKNIIIIFSIGISSVQNVAFASVETFIEGWYFGSLDAICMTYQFGEVSERLAIDHFKRIFNMIEKDKKLNKSRYVINFLNFILKLNIYKCLRSFKF